MWALLTACSILGPRDVVDVAPRPQPDPVVVVSPDPGSTTSTSTSTPAPRAPPACQSPLADGTSICLSELQSDNDSTYSTAPGVFPDWFELLNTGTTPIASDRLLFVVDGEVFTVDGPEIAPGTTSLFVADGQALQGHVGTAFSDEGESIELYLDGVLADVWELGPALGDTSFARDPVTGTLVQTCSPSPASVNPVPTPCTDPREPLYTLGTIRDLRLYIDGSSYSTLQSSQLLSYYPEVPARLVFDTPTGPAEFPQVGLSLKGGYGSFRSSLDSQKPGFKVDLDAFEPRRWAGLGKIQLNNFVQDQTASREYLTYALFRAVGVPGPRVSYARLWVNDVYFGLYVQVEAVDDDFLEHWYGDGDGHLLEAAYGPDFDPGEESSFEYDDGPDEVAGRARISEVSALLAGSPADEATYTTLRTLVDMDEWMTNMAVEAAVWHWDGYWTENNYYVYEVPATGLLHIIPHGTDQTWTDGWPNAFDGNNRSALYTFCLQVPTCRAMYEQKLLDTADAVDVLALEPVLDQLLALTTPEWDADPRIENRCCRQSYADSTRRRIQTVSQSLRDLAALY